MLEPWFLQGLAMAGFDVDFFVIGAGSGGVRAARMAAGFGAKVAIAEERYYGGTCVNVGCIPKKLFVYGSRYSEDVEVARGYGWTTSPPAFDWPTLVRNKDMEITRLNGIYERMLRNAGCEVINGSARLVDAHTVAVGERRITAEHRTNGQVDRTRPLSAYPQVARCRGTGSLDDAANFAYVAPPAGR